MNRALDVGPILGSVKTSCLLLHRIGDRACSVEVSRNLAKHLPNARFIELPGDDHAPIGDTTRLFDEIEEFLTGSRPVELTDRLLATVLFTDIVDSTAKATELGDRRWRELLDAHDRLAAHLINRHRGKLVKSTGDGILATFDGPGRGVRCALALGEAARQVGLPLRAGLHTGEVEVRGNDVGGIAVHVAARVMGQSGANEVMVSRVVTDLVAGAGLKFAHRGSFDLKGISGPLDLFAALQ
jgi:class 3 adenylate cyclase